MSGSLLHLGWNVLAKGARDKLAFLWLALLPPALLGAAVFLGSSLSSGIDTIGLACMVASGVLHALYFSLLTSAYDHADLSFVYPYCRGLGALVATVAGVTWLNEVPSWLGSVGIALTLFAPGLEAAVLRQRRPATTRGSALTLLTGASIGSYLVVDKIGVTHVEVVTYLGGIIAIPVLILAPKLLASGRAGRELGLSRTKPLWAALFLAAAYGVVLAAMQIAPVTYVVAARASGIALSGLAGLLFFREHVGKARWAAITMVAAGVLCIGLA